MPQGIVGGKMGDKVFGGIVKLPEAQRKFFWSGIKKKEKSIP